MSSFTRTITASAQPIAASHSQPLERRRSNPQLLQVPPALVDNNIVEATQHMEIVSDTKILSPKAATAHWIEPAKLPNYGNVSAVAGNAPDYVKQLTQNTYFSYGVGEPDSFGYNAGSAVRFVDMHIDRQMERQGRYEATTVAEVFVSKSMLNGAGMLHGGCIGYLIDNLASTPLVVLGLIQNHNGVGVTQSMNVLFHSPAPLGTCLNVISTSISLGGRVMNSRCEIVAKDSGRIVASAFLNKMQPTSKL